MDVLIPFLTYNVHTSVPVCRGSSPHSILLQEASVWQLTHKSTSPPARCLEKVSRWPCPYRRYRYCVGTIAVNGIRAVRGSHARKKEIGVLMIWCYSSRPLIIAGFNVDVATKRGHFGPCCFWPKTAAFPRTTFTT